MSVYVLTSRNDDALQTDVFSAGAEGQDDAAMMFTSESAAQQYLAEAGLSETQTVGELEAIPLLQWLLALHNHGVQWLAVDPSRHEQNQDQRQVTLDIRAQLEEFGRRIQQLARPDF